MLARIRKSMQEKDQGFTLIELLVVIIIIGILAAIAIPVFLNQRKKGYDAQAKSDLRNAATSMETYLTDNNAYPATGTASTQLASLGWKKSINASDVAITTAAQPTSTTPYVLSNFSDSGQQWCFSSAQTSSGVYKGTAPAGSSASAPTTTGC